MFGNESNSYIWLILLILIFLSQGSSTPISQGDYFKLTYPTNTLFNGLIWH